MSEELKGKTAIVTGASRGIGRSIALAFANNGAKLVIASRNKYGELDKVANEIRETPHPWDRTTVFRLNNNPM